jgi:hypothetical protein
MRQKKVKEDTYLTERCKMLATGSRANIHDVLMMIQTYRAEINAANMPADWWATKPKTPREKWIGRAALYREALERLLVCKDIKKCWKWLDEERGKRGLDIE